MHCLPWWLRQKDGCSEGQRTLHLWPFHSLQESMYFKRQYSYTQSQPSLCMTRGRRVAWVMQTLLNIPVPICTKMLAWLCKMAGSWVSICHRKKVAVPPQTHMLKSWEVGTLGGTEAMKAQPPWIEAIVSHTGDPRELFSPLDMWGRLVCFYCGDKMTENRL